MSVFRIMLLSFSSLLGWVVIEMGFKIVFWPLVPVIGKFRPQLEMVTEQETKLETFLQWLQELVLKASPISISHLPWLAFVVIVMFIILNGWLRIYRRQRREQEQMQSEVVEEIIYGLESGILFGYMLQLSLNYIPSVAAV